VASTPGQNAECVAENDMGPTSGVWASARCMDVSEVETGSGTGDASAAGLSEKVNWLAVDGTTGTIKAKRSRDSYSLSTLSCGRHHVCALTSSQTGMCWGADASNQTGDPALQSSLSQALNYVEAVWDDTCLEETLSPGRQCFGLISSL